MILNNQLNIFRGSKRGEIQCKVHFLFIVELLVQDLLNDWGLTSTGLAYDEDRDRIVEKRLDDVLISECVDRWNQELMEHLPFMWFPIFLQLWLKVREVSFLDADVVVVDSSIRREYRI